MGFLHFIILSVYVLRTTSDSLRFNFIIKVILKLAKARRSLPSLKARINEDWWRRWESNPCPQY